MAEIFDRLRRFRACHRSDPVGKCTTWEGHEGMCLAYVDPDELLCSVVSLSGLEGEPLACGWKNGHAGPHSWASLPTFGANGVGGALVRHTRNGQALAAEVERLRAENAEMRELLGHPNQHDVEVFLAAHPDAPA